MKSNQNNTFTFFRLFIATLLGCLLSLGATACDICGCGVGSYYIGILPDFQKRFVGIRYQSKILTAHLTPSGNRSYLTTDEIYRSAELWGALNLAKRFRILGFIPINHIQKTNNNQTDHKAGLGDVALNAYFNVVKSESTTENSRMLVHSLWLGAGLKTPTGAYNASDSRENQSLNTFQLGSGSVDFLINGMYDIRIQDVGFNANFSYKMNTENREGYQYGNKVTVNMLLYHKFRLVHNIGIAPNTGVLYESSAKDLSASDLKVDLSGGYSMLGTIGTEIRVSQIKIGGNYQIPVSQDLGSGVVNAGTRWMAHISFAF